MNEALEKYIADHSFDKEKIKVLVSGYSRGGAIANFLGKRLNDKSVVANPNNIYTYTFVAPKGAVNKGNYNNILNVVNGGDVISLFAPEEYGFTRYGIDVDTYSGVELTDGLIYRFDASISVPSFAVNFGKTKAKDDKEFSEYILNKFVKYEPKNSTDKAARTRAEFVTNYAPAVQYLLETYFSLRPATIKNIKNDINSKKQTGDIASLMDPEKLYDFLKPYLVSDGYKYNEDEMKEHLKTLAAFMNGPGEFLISLISTTGVMQRITMMHYPEINYILTQDIGRQEKNMRFSHIFFNSSYLKNCSKF